ncbi:MAG: stage III sporulation protein AD [Clostridia bacterium]|jgi:stage III sporulation protein AD|nr:stage III sporulation protein AD [Clostridia bacterium]
MEKLFVIALIGTGLCMILRTIRPEYAFAALVLTCVILLGSVLTDALGLSDTIRALGTRFGISDAYGATLLKMVGVAYLSSFGANLCRDNGQSATAAALELGGRIAILSCALPAITAVLEAGIGLMNGAAS